MPLLQRSPSQGAQRALPPRSLLQRFSDSVEKSWYQPFGWTRLLWPLSIIFRAVTRGKYKPRRDTHDQQQIPIIVIGNLSVGGTGKTPLIIALVKVLQKQGLKPGVISRGYGGTAKEYPCRVTDKSLASEVGDEPLLVAAFCPVVVSPRRVEALDHLLEATDCNVVLSDDGLQHYSLPRDMEIVVIDGQRGLGNGLCLPAGPLREPESRLASVDIVVVNNAGNGDKPFSSPYIHAERVVNMGVQPVSFRRLLDNQMVSLQDFPVGAVNAVAGIGNPKRFVSTLEKLGFTPQLYKYPDHYAYTGKELVFDDDLPVIVTAKDAIKFDRRVLAKITDRDAAENIWILDVEAVPDQLFFDYISEKLSPLGAED